MADGLFRKSFGYLRPADEEAQEIVAGMGRDEVVRVTVRRVRNPRFHRLFFALMNLVWQHQDRFVSREALLTYVKIGVGHVETVILDDGRTVYIPKSISFAKLDEHDFRKFFDAVVRLLVERVLPGWNADDLTAEVFKMVGEDRSVA